MNTLSTLIITPYKKEKKKKRRRRRRDLWDKYELNTDIYICWMGPVGSAFYFWQVGSLVTLTSLHVLQVLLFLTHVPHAQILHDACSSFFFYKKIGVILYHPKQPDNQPSLLN